MKRRREHPDHSYAPVLVDMPPDPDNAAWSAEQGYLWTPGAEYRFSLLQVFSAVLNGTLKTLKNVTDLPQLLFLVEMCSHPEFRRTNISLEAAITPLLLPRDNVLC